MRHIRSIDEIRDILKNQTNDIPLSNIPHYTKLKNVKRGAKLINEAIKNNGFITVVADYDVDGVTSGAVIHKVFKEIGYDNFEIIIPNRFTDGYGISPKIIERINPDTELVITVDNGITAFEAFDILKEKGIKTVLTDHHMPVLNERGEMLLPKADVIINPKVGFDYEIKDICGAKVAWYLIATLKNEFRYKINLGDYLEYLAVATIADVMPLIDLNRAIVKSGLKRIETSDKPFVQVLKNTFNKIDSYTVAFQIAPRINASGRLGLADNAFKFLISESYTEALNYFNKLDTVNEERKEIQEDILNNIEPIEYDRFIFAIGEYHAGVVGIIASRLVELYKKPAIVFNKKEGLLKGSGRSLGNVDLYRLINPLKEYYETFGGHPGACGISVKEEKFEEFAEVLDARSKEFYEEKDYFIPENVIGYIDFDLINEELLKVLEEFEPYGYGNPTPIFVS